jgi:alkanesulfonate monooxygenase SsuD/methylene tetrahydromethanopterin reductase-like flavin-dependent oxidoreductase (luciferase family)
MSVQAVSGGRFEAGIGAGWLEAEIHNAGLAYPPRPERARRFREAVTVIRDLFAGACDFAGEFYNVHLDGVGPVVDCPRLGAALGGPWTISHIGPIVDHIEVVLAGTSLRDGDFNIGKYGRNVTDDDVRRLVDLAREANPEATVGMTLFVAAAASPMTDFMAERFRGGLFEGLAGEPSEVDDALRQFEGYAIDRISLAPTVPGTIEALSSLVND